MIKKTIEFENEGDVERLTVMLTMLYNSMEEHEFQYGGYDQLYEDMAILDSVKNQLKD